MPLQDVVALTGIVCWFRRYKTYLSSKKEEKTMCRKVREALSQLPGIKVEELGSERMAVVIDRNQCDHIDYDRLRQHPLIKQDGVPKQPGISGTICLDECAGKIHLGTYFSTDLIKLVSDTSSLPVPV